MVHPVDDVDLVLFSAQLQRSPEPPMHVVMALVAAAHRRPSQALRLCLAGERILIGIVDVEWVHDPHDVHVQLGAIAPNIVDAIVARAPAGESGYRHTTPRTQSR